MLFAKRLLRFEQSRLVNELTGEESSHHEIRDDFFLDKLSFSML